MDGRPEKLREPSRWQFIEHRGGGEVIAFDFKETVAFDYFDNEKEIAVDYLEMPAGAELDALVAEQVMGWYSNGRVWCDKLGSVGYWINDEVRQKGSNFPAFHPSTDMAAAWPLIEKFNNAFCVKLLIFPNNSAVVSWVDSRRQRELGYSIPMEVRGETVPLALCYAALKATGASK